MMNKTILTGIKPTGMPHLGNYIGAIQPALKLAQDPAVTSYLFIADYHSLTSVWSAKQLRQMVFQVACAWLACGLDPHKTIFYRQSDIPELFELNWILSCVTPKGLMNRGHSYKALLQANHTRLEKDKDKGINLGLYNYPVLMSADILLFLADEVPVSTDQKQHLEIARDLALKFNQIFKTNLFTLPKPMTQAKLIPGLNGEKMSKSKNNHIPLFCSSKELKQKISKIKTDSSRPEDPKDPNESILFTLYKNFATLEQSNKLAQQYQKGIGYGEVKGLLHQLLDQSLREKRAEYEQWISKPHEVDRLLQLGAKKARAKAVPFMQKVRQAIGIDKSS